MVRHAGVFLCRTAFDHHRHITILDNLGPLIPYLDMERDDPSFGVFCGPHC
jgi:hypothetical protein